MKRFVSSFLAIVLCLTPVLTINAGAISREQIRDNAEKAWNKTKYGAGKAWNGTKYGAERAYNGTVWGLGRTWNSTRYYAGKTYNGTAWGLGRVWNGTKYCWNRFYNSGAMNATGAFLRHPIKTIKGISNGQPDIYVPTPTPLPTPTVGINDDDLTEADVIDINRISVKNFFVNEIGKSERKSCEQDKAANLSNSTHVSENCKNYYAILDLFAELKKKYPNETNPFWEGLLNEKNSQRLVTPTPTPTPTPEWILTPEITPEPTPEVVQVAQIEGEL